MYLHVAFDFTINWQSHLLILVYPTSATERSGICCICVTRQQKVYLKISTKRIWHSKSNKFHVISDREYIPLDLKFLLLIFSCRVMEILLEKKCQTGKTWGPKTLLVGSCCSNKHMTTAMFFLSHSRPVALTMDGQNLQWRFVLG